MEVKLEWSVSHQAVSLDALRRVLSVQALSLSELLSEQAVQGEHGLGGLQDLGPPLGPLVVDGGHLCGQTVCLTAQLVLSLLLHLLLHLQQLQRTCFCHHLAKTHIQFGC